MKTDQPDSYGQLDSYGTEARLRFAQRELGISDTTYNKFKVLFKVSCDEFKFKSGLTPISYPL
jgi:hypothetical protein